MKTTAGHLAMQKKNLIAAWRSKAARGVAWLLLVGCWPLWGAAQTADNTDAKEQVAAVRLPEQIERFLATKLVYDKDWPPAFIQWRYEAVGPLSSDTWAFGRPDLADALQVAANPPVFRAWFYGKPSASADSQWLGKGVAWLLRDSRSLVADVVFVPSRPFTDPKTAPRACVAVYTTADGKMIASAEVPLTRGEIKIRIMKHFTYNRLTLLCDAARMKRGFTVPDHVPLRLVLGVTAGAALSGDDWGVTMEIQEGDHL